MMTLLHWWGMGTRLLQGGHERLIAGDTTGLGARSQGDSVFTTRSMRRALVWLG